MDGLAGRTDDGNPESESHGLSRFSPLRDEPVTVGPLCLSEAPTTVWEERVLSE